VGDEPLEASLTCTPDEITRGNVLHRLASKHQLRDIEAVPNPPADQVEVAEALGLRYNIASRYTSFVAVDTGHGGEESMVADTYFDQEQSLVPLEAHIQDLRAMCLDMNALVAEQSCMLDSIETQVNMSCDYVGDTELLRACAYQKKSCFRRVCRLVGAAGGLVADGVASMARSIKSLACSPSRPPHDSDTSTVVKPVADAPPHMANILPDPQVDTTTSSSALAAQSAQAATAPLATTLSDRLQGVVSLQRFDGGFVPSDSLCVLVGLSLEDMASSNPLDASCISLWATALALALLRGPLATLHADWKLVGAKAESWLEQEMVAHAIQQRVDDLVDKASHAARF